ncbi:MAG: hypothetical protein OCD01_06245 [Fibrobacterales bacterium]
MTLKKVYSLTTLVITLTISACNPLESTTSSPKTQPTSSTTVLGPTPPPSTIPLVAKIIQTPQELPLCDGTFEGAVYYIFETETLKGCLEGQWTPFTIAGSEGSKGDQGTDGPQGIEGAQGIDGEDGTPCTGVETQDGIIMSCNGAIIDTLIHGKDGKDGIDGHSCTVTEELEEGIVISCTTGSIDTLYHGEQGGQGKQGITGTQGISCTIVERIDTGLIIECGEGPRDTLYHGTSGSDGTDGRNGTNGNDGANGASFLSGIDQPLPEEGTEGDTYLDVETGVHFTKESDGWHILNVRYDLEIISLDYLLEAEALPYNIMRSGASYKDIVNAQFTDLSSLTGTFIDGRDNATYKTIKIGTQTWMADNLNYSGPTIEHEKTFTIGHCYGSTDPKVTTNCDTYGRLYNWAEAMELTNQYLDDNYITTDNRNGICPEDWHLPTASEYETLEQYATNYFGDTATNSIITASLKSTSSLWNNQPGSDLFGFGALPGGMQTTNGTSAELNVTAYHWSATNRAPNKATMVKLDINSTGVVQLDYLKSNKGSVRCILTE